MKKILAVLLVAIMMLFICSVTAFAEMSPTASVSTDDSSGSSTSPQTGDMAVVFGALALFSAAAVGCVAVKKIKE